MKPSRVSRVHELPFPPSINHYYRNVVVNRRPQTLISAEGRSYHYAVQAAIGRASPMVDHLAVTIWVWMPDARTRDIDNLLKPLLDACTRAGLWRDDSQVKSLAISDRGIARPSGRVVLRVKPR